MSTLRNFIRPLALSLAFAFAIAPLTASAEQKAPAPKVEKVDKKKWGKGDFPMESAKFSEMVEKKISHVRARMEEMLASHPVPDATKAQVRKDFDAAAAAVRAAAKEAGKDGKVTHDEAKEVRKLAKDFKRAAREKYLGKKGEKKAS